MNTAKFDAHTMKISGLMKKWDITFQQKLKYVTFHVWIVFQTQVWILSSVAVEKKSVTFWSNVLLPCSLILPNCLWYHKSLNLYMITLTLKLKAVCSFNISRHFSSAAQCQNPEKEAGIYTSVFS